MGGGKGSNPLRRFVAAPPEGEPLAKRRSFPVCQGLPSVGEVARRRRDGEVESSSGSRSGSPSSNLSVGLAPASSPSRGASGEEAKLSGMPKPPLGRGGGSASALTERLSPAVAHGQALLRTTSQSGLRPPAPLVGEPLAKRQSFPVCQSLPSVGATATTAASGGNREELLGQRPAGCKRQRSRRWEPQPGQWQCEALTERLFLFFAKTPCKPPRDAV